ncbi:hypothetical protein ANO11243_096190 [Dothideomycetidae sp. 11243]|nr:hypothetical protein ANO11243_096190 [fungal sp. No.11243]
MFVDSHGNLEDRLPTRPAYATKGKPVVLWANHFNLRAPNALVLYRYHVNVVPEAKGKKLKHVFELLLQEPGLERVCTDFKSLLLARDKMEDREIQLVYRSEMEDDPQPGARTYVVKIQLSGTLDVGELVTAMHRAQPAADSLSGAHLQILQSLNILLGHYPQSRPDTTTVGGNNHFFFGQRKVEFDLGGGLQGLRGYFRSVRLGTGRLLVNINVNHAVFFRPGPLTELINIFGQTYGYHRPQLERFLRKVRVETTHLPVKKNKAGQKIPRIKTIWGLAKETDGRKLPHPPIVASFGAGAAEVQFWLEPTPESTVLASTDGNARKKGKPKPSTGPTSGQYISVLDFFKQHHNLTLTAGKMPVLNVGNDENPMYMPAEFCNVLPGQVSMKKLSSEQTAKMITFACRRPHLNAQSTTTDGPAVLGLLPNVNNPLASFGLGVDLSMITVPGRVLNPPLIKYSGTSTTSPRAGSWNMIKVKFTKSMKVPIWTSLWIRRIQGPGIKIEMADGITAAFWRKMQDAGLEVPAPRPGFVLDLDMTKPSSFHESQIETKLRAIAEHPARIEMVFIMVPDTDAVIYNRIKQFGDVVVGLHTVCVIQSKAAKQDRQDQYLANVALKVNCKLNGVNHSLDSARLGIIAQGKTMVVGIDVTHPSPGSLSTAPSVAAVVASLDKTLAHFPCELSIQESRKEMVTDLSTMVKARLHAWQQRNRTLPENILVYRDGVSEGQYVVLKDTEIPALRAACDETYPADHRRRNLPRITVVVVGKRHHTRFYATTADGADRSGNPLSGTVVDRGVTSGWDWDFFLQAHTALQGTVKPAHYYVVQDEIFSNLALKGSHPFANPADALEDLTHNLCYLFARATKAVSVCPPAYYADLACERARCYLSGVFDPSAGSTDTLVSARASDVQIHPRLRNSMFYI